VEEREPSYYEIALTHRQVFGVFVVLLLSVVVAFFAGLWLGRREAVALPATMVAEQPAPADLEGEELGELNFFSDAPTPDSTQAPTPRTARTPQPAPAPEAAAEPPIAAPVSAPERTPAPRPERTPPPVAERTPPPVAETAAEPLPASGQDTLVVQVFSSADRTQAQRIVDQLREGGFAALLSPVQVERRTMYRVRIGPFGERADAERAAARIRREFKLDTWITR
jgi:DedD protein